MAEVTRAFRSALQVLIEKPGADFPERELFLGRCGPGSNATSGGRKGFCLTIEYWQVAPGKARDSNQLSEK